MTETIEITTDRILKEHTAPDGTVERNKVLARVFEALVANQTLKISPTTEEHQKHKFNNLFPGSSSEGNEKKHVPGISFESAVAQGILGRTVATRLQLHNYLN